MSNFRRKVLYDVTLTNSQGVDANGAAASHILDASGDPYFTQTNPAYIQADDLDIRDLTDVSDRVALADGSGNLIGTVVSTGGDHHLSTNIIQEVNADANNSSTVNLAAAATFTGTSTSTLGVAGLQVNFIADQNCTVFVDQSSDASNWDISDSYEFNVLTGNFGVTVQAVSSYWRARVTNLSSTTATTLFRLQGILCPVVEPLPRTLDEHQNLRVAINGLKDTFGFKGQFTPIRDLKVAEPFRMVGTSFGSAIDTEFWTAINNGAASASGIANSIATISSGTANSGYGQLTSAQNARFMFAHPIQWRGAMRVTDTTIALNTRRWGAFSISTITPQNGAYFELSAAGALSAVIVKNGTPTAVSSGSFNGDVSEYVLDTSVHAYEIIAFTMGVWFYIDDVLIHKIIPTTTVLYESLDVPSTMTSVNTAAGTTSGTIECFNSTIMRLGRETTQPIFEYVAGAVTKILKRGAGVLQRVVVTDTGIGTTILYDALSAVGGSEITTIDQSKTSGTLTYDAPFSTGLYLASTGAATLETVIYE